MTFNEERSPADFLFLLRTCANGMPRYNGKGAFNTSFHITRDGIRPETLRTIILDWSRMLNERNVTFKACPYDTIQTEPDDFLYLDPPYAATKGMYYGALDNEEFFGWLAQQKAAYALSFDGKCKDRDYTYDVPEHLYDNHIYIRSGNSSFRRVTGNSRDSVVYESLYVKHKNSKIMRDKFVYYPHNLSGKKETYTLSFSHYTFRSAIEEWDKETRQWKNPVRVGIMLNAKKKGDNPAWNDNITVATTSFLPGQKPDSIRMTTQDANGEFTRQLIEQGFAKFIKEGCERHQDYPGAEIEEFPWVRIDVTELYDSYMKEHQQRMKDSPISDRVLCEKYYNPCKAGPRRSDELLYMKCRIGGVEQNRQWVGVEGRKLHEVAELYPECSFQLNELAEEAFEKQLHTYRQAQQRITDASTRESAGRHYLRCKIDGEWQLSKEINQVDWCHYHNSNDIHALAAKYYAKELNDSISRSQGIGR